MKRKGRIEVILKILTDYPGQVFTLNYFSNVLGAAKSSISEDIVILKTVLKELDIGKIETTTGSSGGTALKPYKNKKYTKKFLVNMGNDLKKSSRIIPGGFLYYVDILYNPHKVKDLGEIIAQKFSDDNIDYVMTIETKGIPIALMVANFLNVPLVVARKNNKISEGSLVSVNYVSGSTGELQSMYLTKKAIKRKSKVLIVDDFLKAGGTIKGMIDLVNEFNSKVVGVAVFMEDATQENKLIDNYYSLFKMEIVENKIKIEYQKE